MAGEGVSVHEASKEQEQSDCGEQGSQNRHWPGGSIWDKLRAEFECSVRGAVIRHHDLPRRKGLRLFAPPAFPPCLWHHPADCQARHSFERTAGSTSLGGEAIARLAARLPPSGGALRAVGGRPPRSGPLGLQPDLPLVPHLDVFLTSVIVRGFE